MNAALSVVLLFLPGGVMMGEDVCKSVHDRFCARVNALEELGVTHTKMAKYLDMSIGHFSRVYWRTRNAAERHILRLNELIRQRRTELIATILRYGGACSAEALSSETCAEIIRQGGLTLADSEHSVVLPAKRPAAILPCGADGYLVIVDRRWPPDSQRNALHHEVDSIWASQAHAEGPAGGTLEETTTPAPLMLEPPEHPDSLDEAHVRKLVVLPPGVEISDVSNAAAETLAEARPLAPLMVEPPEYPTDKTLAESGNANGKRRRRTLRPKGK